MKGKITVVFLSLVLVFGMIAASCDNGDLPSEDSKVKSTLVYYESDNDDLPKLYDEDDQQVTISSGDWEKAVPKKLDSGAAWDKLYSLSQRTKVGGVYVQDYIVGKVAVKTAYTAGSNEAKAAAKYAGLPILVKNPAIP